MKKFKVMVWVDYSVTETYFKTVEAENEVDAMRLAEAAIEEGDYDEEWDRNCFDITTEANENSVELIKEEEK